jgi:hypothetical protein
MGTQCLGGWLGHPVSGGHTYRGLVIEVGILAWSLQPNPHKNPVVRKSKEGVGVALISKEGYGS